MSRRLVAAIALAGGLAACAAGTPLVDDGLADSREQSPIAITRLRADGRTFSYMSGFREPARLEVRSEAQWRAVWARIHDRVTPQPPLPEVDFGRETVLVAALGERNSGGYEILVDSVYRAGGELRALVRKTAPGPRCGLLAVMTQPVDVVRVPAQGSPVRFVERDEVRDCH